jgi:hypothetical protein
MPIDTPEKLRAAVNEILEVLPNDLADLVVVLGAATAWTLAQIEDDEKRAETIEVFCRSLRSSVVAAREAGG